jgi:hypothetical protein
LAGGRGIGMSGGTWQDPPNKAKGHAPLMHMESPSRWSPSSAPHCSMQRMRLRRAWGRSASSCASQPRTRPMASTIPVNMAL